MFAFSSTLNIAVAYTSRDEITEAIKEVIVGIEKGMIKERLPVFLLFIFYFYEFYKKI